MTQPDSNICLDEFFNFIKEVKKAYIGFTNLTKDDLKKMTGQVFGTVQASMEKIIDCIGQGAGEQSNVSQSSVSSLNYIKPDKAHGQLQVPAKISFTASDIEDTSGPAVADPQPSQSGTEVQKALEVLDRIAFELKDFYQWLKDKVKTIASDIWRNVRQAFSNMLAWVRGVYKEITSSCGGLFKNTAKVHVA